MPGTSQADPGEMGGLLWQLHRRGRAQPPAPAVFRDVRLAGGTRWSAGRPSHRGDPHRQLARRGGGCSDGRGCRVRRAADPDWCRRGGCGRRRAGRRGAAGGAGRRAGGRAVAAAPVVLADAMGDGLAGAAVPAGPPPKVVPWPGLPWTTAGSGLPAAPSATVTATAPPMNAAAMTTARPAQRPAQPPSARSVRFNLLPNGPWCLSPAGTSTPGLARPGQISRRAWLPRRAPCPPRPRSARPS